MTRDRKSLGTPRNSRKGVNVYTAFPTMMLLIEDKEGLVMLLGK